jgi:hypothetical protein
MYLVNYGTKEKAAWREVYQVMPECKLEWRKIPDDRNMRIRDKKNQ